MNTTIAATTTLSQVFSFKLLLYAKHDQWLFTARSPKVRPLLIYSNSFVQI